MKSTSGRVRRPAPLVLAAAVLSVGVCGLLPEAHAQRPPTPNVRELRLDRALEILREHGLQGAVQNPRDEAPLVVIRQYPASGVEIPRDRVVQLWVAPAPVARVPSITTLSVEQAHAVLLERKLEGEPMGREPSSVAIGHVSRQDPPAGSPVPEDRVVRFWVSAGMPVRPPERPSIRPPLRPSVPPSAGVVPDVRERPFDWALERLAELDLEGFEAGREHSALPAGLVVRQDPEPGTPLRRMRPVVRLWLSLGPRTVPDVRRGPLDRALAALEAAGFPGEVAGEAASNLPRGFVVDQSPEGGTRVEDPELVVRLWLSTGPPPERPEPPPELTIPDVRKMPLRRAVEILRDAGFGGEVVRRQTSQLPLDFVVEQDPPGGARVEETDLVVRLVVSDGRPDPAGLSPWVMGGIGLLVGLGLGTLWRLRRRPRGKSAGDAAVEVVPRSDLGAQMIETTEPLDMNLEIELRAEPDPGEPEVESGGPLLSG